MQDPYCTVEYLAPKLSKSETRGLSSKDLSQFTLAKYCTPHEAVFVPSGEGTAVIQLDSIVAAWEGPRTKRELSKFGTRICLDYRGHMETNLRNAFEIRKLRMDWGPE